MDINGWNVERGYGTADTFLSFPLRVVNTGHKTALKISLKVPEADMDVHCRGSSVQGFKLMLHTPANMPRGEQDYIHVPVNNEVLLSIKPNIITTSNELRKYLPNKYMKLEVF